MIVFLNIWKFLIIQGEGIALKVMEGDWDIHDHPRSQVGDIVKTMY